MKNRSVVEILVISMTLLVMFFMVAATALVIIVELRDPTADTSGIVDSLTSAILLILGALLGLLAGKTAAVVDLSQRPDGTTNDVGRHRGNSE